MAKPTLTVTSDFTDQFNEAIKKFKGDEVLVGIPAEKSARSDSSTINNATILSINEFGSPMNNIPARPVMRNGIKNAQEAIAEQFKLAAQNVLSQGLSALTVFYERAGIIASNSVKKAINAQEFQGGGPNNEGPAESTLRARKAKGFSGTKSLIVTGAMRNSITYVLKGSG